MKEKDSDEYFVPFKGAKLKKDEANQAGVGIIAGIIGIVMAMMFFGTDHKLYSLILVGIFVGVGFFGYGYLRKVIKSKKT